jgi:hypothetical protein
VTDDFSPAGPPAEIAELVRERTEARTNHQYARADELKARIEAAGWRVVDRGRKSSVRPAAPASAEVDGEVRYGSAAGVPAAADVPRARTDPETAPLSIVLVASEEPARLSRLLAAIREHAPAGVQTIVVENDPSDAQVEALHPDAPDRAAVGGLEPEILRTSVRLGYAAALNIGLRRATGSLVLLGDGSAIPTGDAFSPLAGALDDPGVAAVGAFGLLSEEGVAFRPNELERADADPDADLEVAALEGAWFACRRDDLNAIGPVDEHFVTPAWLDVWLSLRLRVGAETSLVAGTNATSDIADGEGDGVEGVEAAEALDSAGLTGDSGQAPEADRPPAPRRALMIDLPLARDETVWPPERTRLNRRNMYRVLDDFGARDDLA